MEHHLHFVDGLMFNDPGGVRNSAAFEEAMAIETEMASTAMLIHRLETMLASLQGEIQ